MGLPRLHPPLASLPISGPFPSQAFPPPSALSPFPSPLPGFTLLNPQLQSSHPSRPARPRPGISYSRVRVVVQMLDHYSQKTPKTRVVVQAMDHYSHLDGTTPAYQSSKLPHPHFHSFTHILTYSTPLYSASPSTLTSFIYNCYLSSPLLSFPFLSL